MVLPGGSVVKNLTANGGDTDLILGLGKSPGEGNGNLFQYSCLGNPMDRGAWQPGLHTHTHTHTHTRVRHDLEIKTIKVTHNLF